MKKNFFLIIIVVFGMLISSACSSAESQQVKIGSQIHNKSVITAKAGNDKKGNAYLYMIMHGVPSALVVMDLNTNKVVKEHHLEKSSSAWGLDVDKDGILWIGGTNDTILYSLDPETLELKDYGNVINISKDTSIQDLIVSDDYVIGSTAYGARVFVYSKSKKKVVKLQQFSKTKGYAKSIAYNENTNTVYVSIGAKAELHSWNLTNDEIKQIQLPDNYKNETYLNELKVIDNHLIARLYPSATFFVYNLDTGKVETEFSGNSRTISDVNPHANEIYYTATGKFYRYYPSKKITEEVGVTLGKGREAMTFDYVRMQSIDKENDVLVGLFDNTGRYFIYDSAKNELVTKTVDVPAQPVDLYTMSQSPDGTNIVVNGYMSGGIAFYNVDTKKSTEFRDVGQMESIAWGNGKIFMGVYPGAKVLEYDMSKPWTGPYKNPRLLVAQDKQKQDRTTALVFHNNYLYTGTYPQNTTEGGLLGVYNLNDDTYVAHKDYVKDQSIISLLPVGDYIYGGTTSYANHKRSPEGAKFFRFPINDPTKKEFIELPVEAIMVTALIKGENQLLYGMANGNLFSYDLETQKFKTKEITPGISGIFKNANLTLNKKDGYVYGTVEGKLFKANPTSLSYEILTDKNAWDIAQDKNGKIYYRTLADLWVHE